MNLNHDRSEKVKAIEKVLEASLPVAEGYQQVIMEAMAYSLLSGGKRLRPMLMDEVYRMFGGSSRVIEPFMAAIEMIHTYSLVHDDLPAMDDDDYRRGRQTTHKVYGEALGILAGDALLNYAFETAVKAFEIEPEETVRIGRALSILAGKAGIFGMIGGQVVDVEAVNQQISEEKLSFIYRLKTGALIEASMMIGAVLAGAEASEIQKIETIAAEVGMAFQIRDDILDVTGDADLLGKPVHSDEKNGKQTYALMHGISEAGREVKRLSEDAENLLDGLGKECGYLKWLLHELVYRES